MNDNINQLNENFETYQEILKNDMDYQNFLEVGNEYVKCYDRLGIEIMEGDLVDVQSDGVHEVYKKEDGQLYFKPYTKESRVSDYFSNDLEKKPKYNLVGECKGNDGNGCFMDSCGHNCGCFVKSLINYSERMYSEEDMKKAFFDGIRVTGEGYNGEYASGNHPDIEVEFYESYTEWFKQFKNK